MKRIYKPASSVAVTATASAVGYEEYRGRFGEYFDFHDDSDLFGADTWEHAEGNLGYTVFGLLMKKAGLTPDRIDLLFAGDLQNQCVASSEGLVSTGIPYLGLYAACSTVCESMVVATMAINANENLQNACIVTTSHNCAAERQFRLPLEYGGQRPPTAQWTATAGGGFLLSRGDRGAVLTEVMPGRMIDAGISDASNMGAAMAPAVVDTLCDYFRESGASPYDFDVILTGDLGFEGSAILDKLMADEGIPLEGRHRDCGAMMYNPQKQDVHCGGSGCGCSASMMAAYFIPEIEKGNIRNMLFLATGALMSPGSIQQGGHIIGIAPLVRLEAK